ncbi:uncharacterized protein LOC111486578 [Cucurbita maxima]|uniref:Uncharacterized protein LOC111486578 n=1 Tax=Cucurbita maxima TaxID=3661 RepID=A0A6J1JQI2_CUCMA|nr:uncharacterized protein LOC111486578 [Cucurbita maxima]
MWVVEKILRLLTDNFENVVYAKEESKDLAKFDELVGSLEAHEQRKRKKEELLDQALQTKVEVVETVGMVEVVKTTVTKKSIMRRDYRVRKLVWERDVVEEEAANQTFSGINVRNMITMQITVTPTNVKIVVKWGTLQKHVEPEKKVEGTTNLAVEDVTDEGLILMAQDEENFNSNTLWYLDSGASNHMCGHEHLFKEMQKIEDGHVSFGDESKVEFKSRDTIHFLQKDGVMGSIQNVYYIPDLKTNILSMGQLTERLLDIPKGPPATPEE